MFVFKRRPFLENVREATPSLCRCSDRLRPIKPVPPIIPITMKIDSLQTNMFYCGLGTPKWNAMTYFRPELDAGAPFTSGGILRNPNNSEHFAKIIVIGGVAHGLLWQISSLCSFISFPNTTSRVIPSPRLCRWSFLVKTWRSRI